jgi:hypothetical protein
MTYVLLNLLRFVFCPVISPYLIKDLGECGSPVYSALVAWSILNVYQVKSVESFPQV